jgi:hypothetical protein
LQKQVFKKCLNPPTRSSYFNKLYHALTIEFGFVLVCNLTFHFFKTNPCLDEKYGTQQMNEKDWVKWVWEIYGWVGNEI